MYLQRAYVIIINDTVGGGKMLNEKKIKIMTKLSIYEKHDGKEDIETSQYYKTDYVRLYVLKTVIGITIAYLLSLLLIGFYKSEYIISKAVDLDYAAIGTYIIGIYVMIITVYVLSAIIGYNIKFDASRKKLIRYNRSLRALQQIYEEEEQNKGGL